MRPTELSIPTGGLQTEVVEVIRVWRSNGDGGTVRDDLQDEYPTAAELAEFGIATGRRRGYPVDGE